MGQIPFWSSDYGPAHIYGIRISLARLVEVAIGLCDEADASSPV
jgi:hypothetical protein